MNYLNGGYVMIKHNATQKDLAAAYKSNRPVLVYDENQKAHWAQINEKVIETIDEETEETITTYEYSYQLLNDIASLVDSAGNPRFIEGDGTPATITGFTSSYCKWSLSGTHLMLVLAGTIDNTTTINNVVATYELPDFILDKIVPITSGGFIEFKQVPLRASNLSLQNAEFITKKIANGVSIQISNITLTAERSFRTQFDLLIDADYSE